MRVLAAACLALASCFGPTVLDGSFFCLDGDECPPGMFCRKDCNPQKCFYDTTTACPADAGVADAPIPVADSQLPTVDAPPGTPDAPRPPDARRPIDGPPITIIDGPPIIPFDAAISIKDAPFKDTCDGPSVITDGGIRLCTIIN